MSSRFWPEYILSQCAQNGAAVFRVDAKTTAPDLDGPDRVVNIPQRRGFKPQGDRVIGW